MIIPTPALRRNLDRSGTVGATGGATGGGQRRTNQLPTQPPPLYKKLRPRPGREQLPQLCSPITRHKSLTIDAGSRRYAPKREKIVGAGDSEERREGKGGKSRW